MLYTFVEIYKDGGFGGHFSSTSCWHHCTDVVHSVTLLGECVGTTNMGVWTTHVDKTTLTGRQTLTETAIMYKLRLVLLL